jgi:hypothetical protein
MAMSVEKISTGYTIYAFQGIIKEVRIQRPTAKVAVFINKKLLPIK